MTGRAPASDRRGESAATVSGLYQPDWKYQRLRMALLAIADGRPMLEAQKLAIDALASVEEDLADAER